jgi:hypothetical protein
MQTLTGVHAVFPPSNDNLANPLPLEIPDVWEGPENYAEDFYSGGDFKLSDGATFDVHQLESDRQGFLTPVISWDGQPGSAHATEDRQDDEKGDLQDNEKDEVVVGDPPLNLMQQTEPAPEAHHYEVDEQPSLPQLDTSLYEEEIIEVMPLTPSQPEIVSEAAEVDEMAHHAILETMAVDEPEVHEEEQLETATPNVFEQITTTERISVDVVDEAGSSATAVQVETSLMTTEGQFQRTSPLSGLLTVDQCL